MTRCLANLDISSQIESEEFSGLRSTVLHKTFQVNSSNLLNMNIYNIIV